MRFRLPGIFLLGLLLALAGTQDASAQKLEIVLQSSNLLQRAGRALIGGRVDEAAALYEEALGAGVSEWETYKALRRGLEVAPRNRRLRHNLEFVEKAYRDGRKEGIRPVRTHPRSRGIV